MNNKRSLVLYHDNCPDGFTAAWVAWLSLQDNADYIAVNYGQPIPDVDIFRPIYILDFSYSRDNMLHLLNEHKARVVVLDHHKTAQSALEGLPDCIFDMNESGASLTWRFFNPNATMPNLVSYVKDRDLWLWKLPHSREISEFMFSIDRQFSEWSKADEAISFYYDNVVEQGAAMLRLKRTRVAKVCENVRWLTFGNVNIPVVNTSWDFSEIGEYLCEQFPNALCGGYYFDRVDKRQWGFRSRTVNGKVSFDVSALCKQYGGGGHQAAAGFTSEIGWLP